MLSFVKTELFSRWQALSSRERKGLLLAGLALFLVLNEALIFSPLLKQVEISQHALDAQQETAAYLRQAAERAKLLRQQQTVPAAETAAAIQEQINERLQALDLERYRLAQTNTSDEITISLRSVPFDALLAWLVDLQQQHGIVISKLSCQTEAKPALVSVELSVQINH